MMNVQPASDYQRLRDQIARIRCTEDRTALAETLLELLREGFAPQTALVVFHHPGHGRPTVFGGTFEDRRRIGRLLRRHTPEGEEGLASIGASIGATVRVVRIGEVDDIQGLIVVGSETRAPRSDEIEYVRFLAGCAAENLTRLGLNSRIQELVEELHTSEVALAHDDRARLLGEVASGIAQEVKAAVSPVSAFSSLLLSTERDPEARRYIELIQQAGADVSRIVDSLRGLDAPLNEVHRIDVGVGDLLVAAVDRVQSDWSAARRLAIRMEIDVERELDRVNIEPDRIVSALVDLLHNASEAIGERGGHISVSARAEARSKGRDEVVISVEDDGCGMEEETLERCTHLFFTTREEAVGIGLTRVRRTARDFDGRFEISSIPGEGTRARIFLPAAAHVQPRLALVEDAPRIDPGPGTARILCIDDNAAVLSLLRTVFERDGHRVTSVQGGQSGVEAFVEGIQTEREFDLVITDLRMPDVHGFGVIRAIRAAAAAVPILVLSAEEQELPEDLRVLDRLEVLRKPIDPMKIRVEIQDMLKGDAAPMTVGAE
jgi:signal transduction histidine kinase